MYYNLFFFIVFVCTIPLQARDTSDQEKVSSDRREDDYPVQGESCLCMEGNIECVGDDILSYSSKFGCSKPITSIIITGTIINSLPSDAFSLHTGVELIAIYNNRLTSLPKDIFSGLTHLKKIVIMENVTLPNGIFQGLQGLEEVTVVGSINLTPLPPRLFAGLHSLKTVSLHKNKLTTLPSDTFASITRLQELDVSRNQLKTIPKGLFSNLKSIDSLVLNNNLLTSVTARDFQGLTFVRRLDLEYNRITQLPSYDGTWPIIQHVYISGNKNMAVTGRALRSWLRDGTVEVEVALYHANSMERGRFVPASELVSLIRDPKVKTKTEVGVDCMCGSIMLGKAQVDLCVDTECGYGRTFSNWVEAVRAAADGSPITPYRSSQICPCSTVVGTKDVPKDKKICSERF